MDLAMVVITVFSVSLAATMSLVAWRLASEERRRSDARITALAADIHDIDFGDAAQGTEDGSLLNSAPVGLAAEMFAGAQPTRQRSRAGMAAVAGLLVVATLAVAVVSLSRGSTAAPRQPPAARAPLELLALDDQFEAGRLTIHGIVRSPAGAPAAAHLVAVVLLFDTDGAFVASGRTEVDATALEAGREGTFAVTVSGATDVSRYRVSFRSDDRVVPHVDRRESARS